jgi:hypothetical protein
MNLSWMIVFTTAVPALIPILWGLWFMRRASSSASWPQVAATLTASDVVRQGSGRSPRLEFAYVAAGQPRVGKRLWVGPRSISATGLWADRVVERFPVGAVVPAAVDPADPGYAVLEPGLRALHLLPLGIGLFILVGGIFAASVAS